MNYKKREVGKYAAESTYILQNNGELVVKNAVLIYRNFSGKPDAFNSRGGIRKFCLALALDVAHDLEELGWNIKWWSPGPDEEGYPFAWTEIIVRMESNWPPIIHKNTEFAGKKTRTKLMEEELASLDTDILERVSVCINPHHHDPSPNGSTIKGYLRNMDAVVKNMDMFAEDYLDYINAEENEEDLDEVPFL